MRVYQPTYAAVSNDPTAGISDLFAVIINEHLLPNEPYDPANYEAQKFDPLEEDCTVEHICDFVVEYINSDVLVRCGCSSYTCVGLTNHRAFYLTDSW